MPIVRLPARTSELWDSLMEYNSAPSLNLPGGWEEAMKLGKAASIVGEVVLGKITSDDDWKTVPSGRSVRVLVLRKGDTFQVRWGDHRMSKIVSGPYRDYLLSRFEAEEFDGIKKSGYLKVFPGKLEVNS